MKIFNWVHRKLNHKDGSLPQNAKKSSAIANVVNEELIVDQENRFGEVFGDWKGGILTIGTFGYHPLKDEEKADQKNALRFEQEEKETVVDDEMTDSDEEPIEEVKPLVYADYNAHDYKVLLEIKMDDTLVTDHVKSEIEVDHSDSKLKERTTLADLFSAETEEKLRKKEFISYKAVEDLDYVSAEMVFKDEMKKICIDEKHGDSFQKKLKGDTTRPMCKLNRLMRKMLKKKIHPADLSRLNNPNNGSNVQVDKCGTTETATVFLIQDAII